MFFAFVKRLRPWAVLAGAGAVALCALPAHAQYYPGSQPWPAPAPWCPSPGTVAPLGSFTPGAPAAAPTAPPRMPSATEPTTPSTPQQPTTPTTPSTTTPEATTPQTTTPSTEALAEAGGTAPSTEAGGAALGATGFSATGYIDSAIPVTMFRLRFDAAYDDNRPDRAEFFYAKCGCFASPKAGKLFDPSAAGPPQPETSIDYQEFSPYFEYAFSDRFSAFIEAPYLLLNPVVNRDKSGFSDMNVGFKYAVLACDDHFLTFQLRTYIPTGDSHEGLGTDHVSLEPAVLWHQRLADRLALDTEFRDWIPIGGTDFAGNVTRYGAGLSYLVLNRPNFRVIPVGEVVGWTVLSGKELEVPSLAAVTTGATGVKDPAGDTIVNAKVGARFGFGPMQEKGFFSRSDLYVGYGRALTGDVWYKDILRVEFRMVF